MRAILYRHNDCAVSIPKFGPEIKNRCTKEGENGENRASILKSEPEIKNRCTQEGLNREKLAVILKSGLEIKNRCTPRAKSREKFAAIPNSDSRIKNRCSKGRQNSHRFKAIRTSSSPRPLAQGHQNILQPKAIGPNHQSSSGNGTGLPSAGLKGMGLLHSRSLSERIVASSAHF